MAAITCRFRVYDETPISPASSHHANYLRLMTRADHHLRLMWADSTLCSREEKKAGASAFVVGRCRSIIPKSPPRNDICWT